MFFTRKWQQKHNNKSIYYFGIANQNIVAFCKGLPCLCAKRFLDIPAIDDFPRFWVNHKPLKNKKMEKLDSLVERLNSLDTNDKKLICGGYVSISLRCNDPNEQDTNYFQCHCNNYCPKSK